MKPIGGFFELLLPRQSVAYHEGAVALSNGRACIRTMLRSLDIKKCYVPNYTCDAVYCPFELEGVDYELYSIDEHLNPVSVPTLAEGEFFYYINYFGVKNGTVNKLYDTYGDRLLIDNTHDFFKKRQHDCWSFTSARKYFGVPDGAFLYGKPGNNVGVDAPRFKDYSLAHCVDRLKGDQDKSLQEFREYEASLNSEIYRISRLSEKMLSSVDVEEVSQKRKDNFQTLHARLREKNRFILDDMSEDDVPFAYPFLPEGDFDKTALYTSNIFIPTLWADPLAREGTTDFERRLATTLMPLPVDHRYGEEEMGFMAEQVLKELDNG